MSKRGQAKVLFDRIGFGRDSMVMRPSDKYIDRVLRRMINKANKHDDCIINVGDGYYRPVPGNAIDEKELDNYLFRDLHMARDILLKRLKMRTTFERWRECGILLNNTDKTG